MKKIRKNFLVIFIALFVSFSCASDNANIIHGKITSISKYGNVTTDILKSYFEDNGFELGDLLYVKINNDIIVAPYGSGYPNVDTGKVIILSSDGVYISVAINMGNFSNTYTATKNSDISFALSKKHGYLDELRVRSVESRRTNNRADYNTDEIFANFREVAVGNIKPNRLYRSSNPVNPELGRNEFADRLIKDARIKTVMNLADSKEELESYPSYNGSYYSTLDVIPLDMGVDFKAVDFNEKLNRGLTFLSEHDSPYLVHCTEGKDRAGFVNALLECLGGASFEEIVNDYMITYENYYGVQKESKEYSSIANSNIYKMLISITNSENIDDVKKVDLSLSARNYLENTVGLSSDIVDTLYRKLCT